MTLSLRGLAGGSVSQDRAATAQQNVVAEHEDEADHCGHRACPGAHHLPHGVLQWQELPQALNLASSAVQIASTDLGKVSAWFFMVNYFTLQSLLITDVILLGIWRILYGNGDSKRAQDSFLFSITTQYSKQDCSNNA